MLLNLEYSHLSKLKEIWINGIKDYNDKLDAYYWKDKLEIMENYFKNNNTIIYSEDNIIKAFVTYEKDGNIIAIFVDKKYRNFGIGTVLINNCKENENKLYASVVENNLIVNNFFLKNGFLKKYLQRDENTGIIENFYEWRKNENFC